MAESPESCKALDGVHPHTGIKVLHFGHHETGDLIGNLHCTYQDHGGYIKTREKVIKSYEFTAGKRY